MLRCGLPGQLTYEKKHELNIGADMGFLDNRINFAVDWYTRNNYDLIGIVNTPVSYTHLKQFTLTLRIGL